MKSHGLSVGSLVSVIAYGPYWGIHGTILAVDAITLADQPALYFYLVALHEGQVKEPLWLMHEDVAIVEGEQRA